MWSVLRTEKLSKMFFIIILFNFSATRPIKSEQ